MNKFWGDYRENSMKKCKYCGKKLNDNFEFCNSKCENCYEKMVDKDNHKISLGNVEFDLYSEEFKKVIGTYRTDVNRRNLCRKPKNWKL